MSKLSSNAHARIEFNYNSLRTISSPDDQKNERKIFCGHAPAKSFINLPDNENVRTYLVDAEGKQRKRLSDVHREIRDTLENRPEDFSILNSGIVIVARSAVVDDANKKITLVQPSIINGSQTRGELDFYINNSKERELQPHNVHAKFEIIVTADDELIAEISIARNFQNDVARLSIAGRRKQLEELEASLKQKIPNIKLRKSETDRSSEYYDTEKLIQVITALIPPSLWPKQKESSDPRKTFCYSGKSKCLKDFQDLYSAVKNDSKLDIEKKRLYDFFIDTVPYAYSLYEKWKMHQGFKGSRLHAIERDKSGNVVRVPDGIIFPIIAALSTFMEQEKGHWKFHPPAHFTDDDIIKAAINQYIETAKSNPTTMGKTQSIYSSLLQLTSIFKRLSK